MSNEWRRISTVCLLSLGGPAAERGIARVVRGKLVTVVGYNVTEGLNVLYKWFDGYDEVPADRHLLDDDFAPRDFSLRMEDICEFSGSDPFAQCLFKIDGLPYTGELYFTSLSGKECVAYVVLGLLHNNKGPALTVIENPFSREKRYFLFGEETKRAVSETDTVAETPERFPSFRARRFEPQSSPRRPATHEIATSTDDSQPLIAQKKRRGQKAEPVPTTPTVYRSRAKDVAFRATQSDNRRAVKVQDTSQQNIGADALVDDFNRKLIF